MAPRAVREGRGPFPASCFITDPSADCELDEELLATLYSRTAAEDATRPGDLRGETLAEFSASSGLS
jgi:hypothetical protein